MSVEQTKQPWGKMPSGEQIYLYTLTNANGIEAQITSFGARVTSLKTPDRHGRFEDIVLGFDDLGGYLSPNPYFGATVGRYANRIARGEFSLAGITYRLARNNGENSLHGGVRGFDKVVWNESAEGSQPGSVQLQYLSADGEEGYPGNLQVNVHFTLTNANELRIDFLASTDKLTVLNLTNHSYFNLAGQSSGNILDHVVSITADEFTPVNAHLIPTGERRKVAGTPFDFRQPEPIGKCIDQRYEQLELGWGYDHNYVLKSTGEEPVIAARALDPNSGRALEVFTTQPGMQFYTGNHLDGSVRGKGGTVYSFRAAYCFETQHFPDSPNHPDFPSTELRPEQRFRQTTIYKFRVE
jgi:aldose 1-epimerase